MTSNDSVRSVHEMLAEPGAELVRELLLRRRRARVPWVYLLYHRSTSAADDTGRGRGFSADAAETPVRQAAN